MTMLSISQLGFRSDNEWTDIESIMVLNQREVLNKKRVFLAVVIMCTIFIFCTDLSPDLYFIHWSPLETINCYYDNTDDVLLSTEGRGFMPVEESIFFHETSCRGGLNSRQACAVEAAARAHSDWDVYVLFTGPVKTFEGPLKTLQSFRNVRYARIHLDEYARGTPLESLVLGGALNRTRWRISHTSDVLRYLTLYKWGGVYLDLDTVVVKSFNSLEKNWSAKESEVAVAAGAMSFSRDHLGRMVAGLAVRDLAVHFRGDKWGHNGPGVITRILKNILCSTDDVSAMSADTCRGFEVYGPELFYPIRWQDAQQYFKPGLLETPGVYIYHVWNQKTRDTEILENSRYANLAKSYCPTVYENHAEDFGVQSKRDYAYFS